MIILNNNIKFSIAFILSLSLIILSGCENTISPSKSDISIQDAENYAISQLKKNLNTILSNNYPIRTKGNGEWEFTDASAWTSGFYPGCLWYAYNLSNDSSCLSYAEKVTQGLDGQQYNITDHDIGFRIFNSYGNGYKIKNNSKYKEVILQAANSLAARFNHQVGCIQSWDGEFQVIIDNMMNLEILFWASKNGGGNKLYDMAVSHAYKTLENQIRTDGSCYQLVVYDEKTGKAIKKSTVQGYSDSSTWSRGQVWGIYGFTVCYRETKDVNFLNKAIKMADYFIDHLPSDYIPYWDLNLPDNYSKKYRDASAAAIAASAFLELSKYTLNNSKYSIMAEKILESLSDHYLSINTNSRGILLHCAYNVNSNNPYDWDASTIWGDYYYLEALDRYVNK